MTTQSWNTPITHTNDAQFRAWGSELSARLAAIGLVQTADTGQINWVTVTRPGTNVAAGYEVWRFNDSLQGSAPIFIKVEYGTSSGNSNSPQVWITVGTGSNGSGTITGSLTSRLSTSGTSSSAINTVANYPSFACAVEGLAWVANKYGGAGVNRGFSFFAVVRTCDSGGTPTGDGFVVYAGSTSSNASSQIQAQAIRTLAPATVFPLTTDGFFSMIVHGLTTTVTPSGDTQASLHWMPTPEVRPVFGICSIATAESSFGASFSTTLVGSTPRTYVSIHSLGGQGGPGNALLACPALVYE